MNVELTLAKLEIDYDKYKTITYTHDSDGCWIISLETSDGLCFSIYVDDENVVDNYESLEAMDIIVVFLEDLTNKDDKLKISYQYDNSMSDDDIRSLYKDERIISIVR